MKPHKIVKKALDLPGDLFEDTFLEKIVKPKKIVKKSFDFVGDIFKGDDDSSDESDDK